MKTIWITLLAIAVTTPAWAASNCVSRVDKNLNKTTQEKINYCLEEDQTPEAPADTTEIVWSETYSVQFPKQKQNAKEKEAPQTQIKTVPNDTPVSKEYLDRKTYPPFRNDTMPRMSAEQAHETAMEALQQNAADKTDKQQKPAKRNKNAGKPKRQVKADNAVSAKVAPAEKPAAAPSAQVQEAQALQNDPLATNPTDNGAVPADFLDDGVMGPSDFGYNATDPAFQQ
ncbi:MAG: hypothetical protein IKN49_06020 [Elusimicrobiaceae bacterium]|nr:hypothetical protein [Elusimicrobiaceae bacterium]